MSSAPVRVFISYSHDSPVHMDRVLELSDRLRADGVDCQIDQYEESPPEGWPTWCMNQVKDSQFVITVCSETYERRFSGKEEPGRGRGVAFEGYVVTQTLYDEQCKNVKFVPTIFSAEDAPRVPTILKGASLYDVSNNDGYKQLYRRLTGQPSVTKPPLGEAKAMPPKAATKLATLQKFQRKQEFLTPIWNVPLARNPFFTGRENILGTIEKKFGPSKRVALKGMRGVGKTQIAAYYAHLHRREYQDVLWARAETRDTLTGDFAAIARLLDLSRKDEKDQSVIVNAVKGWLEANGSWLLILDNADDLALAQEFLPEAHPGQVLLTTTAQALGGLAERVPVDEMDTDEGALLLLRRAAVIDKNASIDSAKETDRELARSIANEFDGLPLALDQAGAFIEETPSTLAEYSDLYKKEGARLRKQRGELRTDTHPSVTVTFSLAFNELAKRDSTAADLVRICAFLAPDSIPEEVFARGGAAIGEEFAKRVNNPLDFTETVRQAAKFSLLRRDASDRSLDIHRIVQEVLKDEMSVEQRRAWAERAVRAMNAAFPNVEFHSWPQCERLLPHSKACAALIERFSFEFREAAVLLNQTAYYMDDRAQYREAAPLFQRALVINEKALGREHPDVATSLNNLAVLYREQGRDAEAEPLHERALAIREKSFGPDHPAVANSLNNLAALYTIQRRYAEAEPLHQRALKISEKVFGTSHPNVATCLNNLAEFYREQARYAEAEPLSKRALAIDEKAFGPEHPDVATDLNNLAMLYSNQGRYAEAERLHQSALKISEKVLGADHPNVATCLNHLALLYSNQGRYDEAERLHQGALKISEKALGVDHPNVATCLNNLVLLYSKQGRYAEAEPLSKRALTIYQDALGQEHPSVVTALGNYVDLLRKLGRDLEMKDQHPS
jgi:tetratricopeptide (TPR) repeat protein